MKIYKFDMDRFIATDYGKTIYKEPSGTINFENDTDLKRYFQEGVLVSPANKIKVSRDDKGFREFIISVPDAVEFPPTLKAKEAIISVDDMPDEAKYENAKYTPMLGLHITLNDAVCLDYADFVKETSLKFFNSTTVHPKPWGGAFSYEFTNKFNDGNRWDPEANLVFNTNRLIDIWGITPKDFMGLMEELKELIYVVGLDLQLRKDFTEYTHPEYRWNPNISIFDNTKEVVKLVFDESLFEELDKLIPVTEMRPTKCLTERGREIVKKYT